MTVSHNSRL